MATNTENTEVVTCSACGITLEPGEGRRPNTWASTYECADCARNRQAREAEQAEQHEREASVAFLLMQAADDWSEIVAFSASPHDYRATFVVSHVGRQTGRRFRISVEEVTEG